MNIFQNRNFRWKCESWIRFKYLCNKADLKNATGFDTSKFAKKFDLASLKSNVDKLDNDQFKNVYKFEIEK